MDSTAVARIFKGLSEGLRLRLVRLLATEELNVNELKHILEVPQSTLSRHLGVLKETQLLDARRQGPWTYYRLAADPGLNGSGETLVRVVTDLLHEDETADHDRGRLEEVLEMRRQAVREHFETSGHTWDELHGEVADHGVKMRALSRLVPAQLTLVDAGTGSGYLLPELAATGAHVIAVDNSPNRLDEARRLAEARGLDDVEFREGDLASLPVEAGTVDGVFAHLVLHHASRPEAVVRGMREALKPGGVMVVTDFMPHEEAWLRDEHADIWLGFEPEEVASWMAAAGLEEITCEEQEYSKTPNHSKGPGPDVSRLRVFVLSGRAPLQQKARET